MSLDSRVELSAEIQQMLDETSTLITRRYPVLRSLLIIRNGRTLCARRYGKGVSENCTEFPIAPVKSVTKSIVALLIGVLIDRKLITGVNQTLGELLTCRTKELQLNNRAAELTLHQLLSMTTGFLWRGGRASMEPLIGRMMANDDWLRFILALPVVSEDVGKFKYNSAVSHLLSVVIEEVAGVSSAEFARRVLFAPMGIEEFEWQSDPVGKSIGGWGLSMSALSMAKIGQLCIDRGVYNGEILVSSEWIQRMWTPVCVVDSEHGRSQPGNFEMAKYGYQWWLRGNSDIQLYCAEGAGGQMIICIPSLRALVVTSCEYTRRGTSLWPLIENHWIPALLLKIG